MSSVLISPRLLMILLVFAALTSTGCATYKVSHVTDHDGHLYLTTDKKTTLFYVVELSSEQAIAACSEKNGSLECKELDVTIDGSEWTQ